MTRSSCGPPPDRTAAHPRPDTGRGRPEYHCTTRRLSYLPRPSATEGTPGPRNAADEVIAGAGLLLPGPGANSSRDGPEQRGGVLAPDGPWPAACGRSVRSPGSPSRPWPAGAGPGRSRDRPASRIFAAGRLADADTDPSAMLRTVAGWAKVWDLSAWTGSPDNPSAVSAIRAISRVIGAASASIARERALVMRRSSVRFR